MPRRIVVLTMEFEVTGMSCAHCERAVESEVRQLRGVREVRVSAAAGRLIVESETAIPEGAVLAAVDEAGYEAVRVGEGATATGGGNPAVAVG